MKPPIPYSRVPFPLETVIKAFMAVDELDRFTFSDEGIGSATDLKEHPYADQADDN